ncbi:hypothetical protein EMIHUDRAFT_195457 [Emiliania huxleyi CCMP1516]|uniref:Myb-like domain-containing protein n=2 Tax=Emiliania huxleyi TaxID=2903 RepID=A0A0D3JHI9_EMIH1|nr:hypothetical protein EMIHUDRAFT_195457 [Emiliania huxleyi CCMP1516]EOD22974.1 hypothetical protein EMIHUDRAFT_195457 [Emiliania huxleyi CCMP1516]|eukprot:XP_005775403.1 hypothetical protein EMIHUDRAFT_195457 [Emiliania huxleyi CCMP1516]
MESGTSGLATPASVADSIDSDVSEEGHRRFHTAPARYGARSGQLKRRSAPPIWEVAHRFHEEAGGHDERSLSERVSDIEAEQGPPSSIHDSWPRVRKQRSDEEGRSMTLWQLSNAMRAPPISRSSSIESGCNTRGSPAPYDPPAAPSLKQQMAAALRHGPSPMSKVAPAEGVFDNTFVDSVLGDVDNMHLTDRKRDGVRQYGYRWRRIASQLQGRSDDAVRNRWSRLKGGEEGEPKAGLSKGGASGRNAAGDTGVTAFPEPSP